MRETEAAIPSRKRGRPRADRVQGRVVELLQAAAEKLLREHSHLGITERQIAQVAGVDEAMIRYYYGGKDGLLFELVARRSSEVLEQLKALDALDPYAPSVTRQIFRVLADIYYDTPWIVRLMASEMPRPDSAITALFMKKYGPKGLGRAPLHRLIERLRDAGIYRRDIEPERTAFAMISIVTGAVTLAPLLGDIDAALRQVRGDAWLDYLALLFEAELAPGVAKSPHRPASKKLDVDDTKKSRDTRRSCGRERARPEG